MAPVVNGNVLEASIQVGSMESIQECILPTREALASIHQDQCDETIMEDLSSEQDPPSHGRKRVVAQGESAAPRVTSKASSSQQQHQHIRPVSSSSVRSS